MRTLEQENDLFFIDCSTYELLKDELKTMVVCPKLEFQGHALYKTFHVSNCHRTWGVMDYDYVIVAKPGWYERLPKDKRRLIYDEQKRTGSRMMMGNVLMTQDYWTSLSKRDQQKVIHLFDERIDDIDVSHFPERFRKLHGQYPEQHGGNCFAAALYGATGEEFLLTEWVHDQTFIEMLDRNGYGESHQPADDCVVVFKRDGCVVHACYMIDEEYCFNKSGQTFFNPWHIAKLSRVITDWMDCEIVYYTNEMQQNQSAGSAYQYA